MSEPATDPAADATASPVVDDADIRRRALAGVALVGLRGAIVRIIGLVGSVVLARLLDPAAFGVAAIGLTIMLLATFLTDAGVAAGFVRQPEQPDPADLRAVVTIQLAGTTALVVLVGGAAVAVENETLRVTALMVAALPIGVLRTPAAVLLERGLDYRPLVVTELVETVTFYGVAAASAAAGWGPWSLAVAAVIRAAVGSGLLLRLVPGSVPVPTRHIGRARRFLGFGAKYQAIGLANVVRDQGLNVLVAAVGGVRVLGLWTVAYRLLQIPFLVFESLWRVSFPAVSRLLATGADVRPHLRRGAGQAAVVTAVALAPIPAGGLVVPALLGAEWTEVGDVVIPAAAGLMVSGPMSAVAAGYLLARGQVDVLLRAVVLHSIAWAAVAAALLPQLGVGAMGWGWLVACVVETALLERAVRADAGVGILDMVVVPTLVWVPFAVLAAAVGTTTTALAAGLGVGAFSLIGVVGVLFVVDRQRATDAWRTMARAARLARAST